MATPATSMSNVGMAVAGCNWVLSWIPILTEMPTDTSLALDNSGNPVVSWHEYDGTSFNIYVKRWNGSSWVKLGTFLDANTNQNALEPSLALDSSGNPVVSWFECVSTDFLVALPTTSMSNNGMVVDGF